MPQDFRCGRRFGVFREDVELPGVGEPGVGVVFLEEFLEARRLASIEQVGDDERRSFGDVRLFEQRVLEDGFRNGPEACLFPFMIYLDGARDVADEGVFRREPAVFCQHHEGFEDGVAHRRVLHGHAHHVGIFAEDVADERPLQQGDAFGGDGAGLLVVVSGQFRGFDYTGGVQVLYGLHRFRRAGVFGERLVGVHFARHAVEHTFGDCLAEFHGTFRDVHLLLFGFVEERESLGGIWQVLFGLEIEARMLHGADLLRGETVFGRRGFEMAYVSGIGIVTCGDASRHCAVVAGKHHTVARDDYRVLHGAPVVTCGYAVYVLLCGFVTLVVAVVDGVPVFIHRESG